MEITLNIYIYTYIPATLTDVLPSFSLSCKANARVYLAKTGHGPHSSQLVNCVVICIVLKCVVICIVLVDCVVLCIVFVDCVVLCIVFVDCVVLCIVCL